MGSATQKNLKSLRLSRLLIGFCRIGDEAATMGKLCYQNFGGTACLINRNALPDRRHRDPPPLICGLSAELPAHRRNDGGAGHIGRPFIGQPALHGLTHNPIHIDVYQSEEAGSERTI